MKRFLSAVVAVILVSAALYYGVYFSGFYVEAFSIFQTGDVKMPFRVSGKEIEHREADGTWQKMVFRGVEVSQSVPGRQPSEYAAGKSTYLRWLEQIHELGANAVKVAVMMDADFYNAFYEWNHTHPESPLYLLQGIGLSEGNAQKSGNFFDSGVFEELLKSGKLAVDVCHGRRMVASNRIGGTGSYTKDISPWVIGYLYDGEWPADMIAYTDHSSIRSAAYHGRFFEAAEDASISEAMFAELLDTVASFEYGKYHAAHPVGFSADATCDFLTYKDIYARQLQKYAVLDAEKILPTDAAAAGHFAAYRLSDFHADYETTLAEEWGTLTESLKAAYGPLGDRIYGGYMELLSGYHTMPVLASSFTASSARGVTTEDRTQTSEQKQGVSLLQANMAMEQLGFAGGFVASWQDVWTRRSWNTSFAADPDRSYLWHDLQTEGQNAGLMAFEPVNGRDGVPVCTLDGSGEEWLPEDLVAEQDGLRLSARYDAKALYLLVEGTGAKDLGEKDLFDIVMDISPESGSTQIGHLQFDGLVNDADIRADRDVDFLLRSNAFTGGRLYVQERYDAVRAHFGYEMTGEDPFTHVPAVDGTTFVQVTMPVENHTLLDESDLLLANAGAVDVMEKTRLKSFPTGEMLKGNGTPGMVRGTDICWGEDFAEIRLPWLMINVGDPSMMRVHGDYYTHYGVDFLKVNTFWIGIARQTGTETITLSPFSVKGWGNRVQWTERLKESYRILQEHWKGGAD